MNEKSTRNHQSPKLTTFVAAPDNDLARAKARLIELVEAMAVRDARLAYQAEKGMLDEARGALR